MRNILPKFFAFSISGYNIPFTMEIPQFKNFLIITKIFHLSGKKLIHINKY